MTESERQEQEVERLLIARLRQEIEGLQKSNARLLENEVTFLQMVQDRSVRITALERLLDVKLAEVTQQHNELQTEFNAHLLKLDDNTQTLNSQGLEANHEK